MTVAPQVWIWVWRLGVWQAWIVAALWVWRGLGALFGLPKVPDLLRQEYDSAPLSGPSLVVVVPALNEGANVGACLKSLLAQDYEALEIVAVDDRSTDGTWAIMDELAATDPKRMRVIHVKELPEGWLGKTHAMALAARSTASEYILFTDADVIFKPDALRRSMAFAVQGHADHLVTVPTLDIRRWDEAALLGFLQVCGLWAARPWKVVDAKAKRDAVGIGAFNLLRRSAYEQVGGFAALRMSVVEDLTLARRIRKAGLAQRIAFGRGLVTVHWASGATGLVKGVMKNMFSAFHFRIALGAGSLRMGRRILRSALDWVCRSGCENSGSDYGRGNGGGLSGDGQEFRNLCVVCVAVAAGCAADDLCNGAVDGDDAAAGRNCVARHVLRIGRAEKECGSAVVMIVRREEQIFQ